MELKRIIRKAQTKIDPATEQTYLPTMPLFSASTPVLLKKPACRDCDDLGWVRADLPVSHPDFGTMIRCHCQAANEALRLQRISGLSELELTYSLDDIQTDPTRAATSAMVAACRKFVESPSHLLTIWGNSGNAKSVAMIGAVNALLKRQVESVYVVAFDLLSYIRQAFNQKTEEVKDDDAYSRLLKFENTPVLAIDELDKVFPLTAWEAKQLTNLIDHRYRYSLSQQQGTILTMNKDPRVLFEGDLYHIYSRLAQHVILRNNDSDLRPHMRGTHE